MQNDGKGRVKLSPRECQVLQLICEGLTYKEIAERMKISPNTVASYICDMHAGFGVSSNNLLAVWAVLRPEGMRGEWSYVKMPEPVQPRPQPPGAVQLQRKQRRAA